MCQHHGQARYCSACSAAVASTTTRVIKPTYTAPDVTATLSSGLAAIQGAVHSICTDLTSTSLFGLSSDDAVQIASSFLPSFLKLGLLSYVWASQGNMPQYISAADAQSELLRVGLSTSATQSVQALAAAVLAIMSVNRLCRNEVVAEAAFLGRRVAAVETLRIVINDVAAWASTWNDDVRSAQRTAVDTALRLAADALQWAAIGCLPDLQRDPRQSPAVGALLRMMVGLESVVPGSARVPRTIAVHLLAEEELFLLSGAAQGSKIQAEKLHSAAVLLSQVVGILHAPPGGCDAVEQQDVDTNVWCSMLQSCVRALRLIPIGGPLPLAPSMQLIGSRLTDVLLQMGRTSQAIDVWFRLVASSTQSTSSSAGPLENSLGSCLGQALGVLELVSLLPYNDPSMNSLVTRGWHLTCELTSRVILGEHTATVLVKDTPDLLLADASLRALLNRCTSSSVACMAPRSVRQTLTLSRHLPEGENTDTCSTSVRWVITAQRHIGSVVLSLHACTSITGVHTNYFQVAAGRFRPAHG